MAIFSAIASAAIPAVASFLSGNKQADAASAAARVSARAAAQARADLEPFRTAGVNALGQQEALLGLGGDTEAAMNALSASPGFQFRLGQGVNALDQSASASGGLFSGNQGQALTEYGQNFASNEFGNYFNQLGTLSGNGQNAAAGTGAASIQGANAQAQGLYGAANAFGNSAAGISNAITGGLENYEFLTQRDKLNTKFGIG